MELNAVGQPAYGEGVENLMGLIGVPCWQNAVTDVKSQVTYAIRGSRSSRSWERAPPHASDGSPQRRFIADHVVMGRRVVVGCNLWKLWVVVVGGGSQASTEAYALSMDFSTDPGGERQITPKQKQTETPDAYNLAYVVGTFVWHESGECGWRRER